MAWKQIILVLSLAVAACQAANTACASGPCLSGGTCAASGTSSYTCTCATGYTGANCQYTACDAWSRSLSIGYSPRLRGALDGAITWTMVQKDGFPQAGTLTGFKFYAQAVRPISIGIYRPKGGCSFTLVKLFTPNIQETGVVTYNLPASQRIQLQANDTIGHTWTNYGTVSYDGSSGYPYCEDSVSPPAEGAAFNLVDRRYGNRIYSIQALYIPASPATPGPSLGFLPEPRGVVDGAQLWTMVQTRGFETSGKLVGFQFYVQAVRPVQLGLYRPVSGCTFTLLKSWTPSVTSVGYVSLSFTGSDQIAFQAGDTIGYTWTGYGSIPFDGSSEYNYCDDNVGQPAEGSQIALVGGRYGNRYYSVRAVILPDQTDYCSSSPCLNGGQCCNGPSSFQCQCPAGTVQPNCARATSCSQNPCINGGTCVTVSKTSYSCTCLPGYSGANCETRPCDNTVTQSIGHNPVWRAGLDGAILWTFVQIQGFPTAGVLTGFRFYSPYARPLQIGIYRPQGSCKFKLLQSWSYSLSNIGYQSIPLAPTQQFNFQAGDTLGFTWTNYGVVSYNDVNGYNYCENNVGQPAIGSTVSLTGGRYGNRLYSIEAVYIANGPGVLPAPLGFGIVPRTVDGAIAWTMIQIRGFQTAGTLIGFRFFVGAVRPLQLGLYRPAKGTCAYQLLKAWTPYVNNIGEMLVYFSGSDRVNFQVGDTFGYTWTNYGVIPYDASSDYNYCEDSVTQPAVGAQLNLVAGRYGNRFYSMQALYQPAVAASVCLAPSGCSPNPCVNGGSCTEDSSVDVGFICTCPEGFSGDNCEIAPATEPCGVDLTNSLSIGNTPVDRGTVDGAILWTMVQNVGFPSAGILTGFKFYASAVRPLTLGLYRPQGGCSFTLIRSWSPRVTSVGAQTFTLSAGDQIRFQAGDTVGLTWTQYGVIPFVATSDYPYCEDSVSPPAVNSVFNLQAGRYGNRLYSLQAFYDATSLAPLSLGWDLVYRGALDGAIVWTMVQKNGFQTDGVVTGFQFYVQAVRPLQLGIYRPVSGCTFVLLKVYTPPVANMGVNTFIISPSDQYRFQKGDTIGYTWTAYGTIPYEGTAGYPYCEDSQAVTSEGSTVTLIDNRYGNRVYSLKALYNPVSSTGHYVNFCANSPCQNGGTCCSTTSSYQCTCPANTLLPNCAPADPCTSSPCANGGSCTKISSTVYSCQCRTGFSGDSCGTVVPNPCDATPCQNGGTCTRLDNTHYSCTCTSTYLGTNCETAIQPCSTSPCKNGATCSSSGSSYTCQCKIGFSGTKCDTVVPNPCDATPCQNGGVCTRVDNTNYSCSCSSSYAGTNCESALPCASSPCKNGGTCSNVGTTDYDCNCPDDYNDGDTCSIYQDPCTSSPCQNGGTCKRVSFKDYTCTCTSDYLGQFCEIRVGTTPCDNTPCLHSGVCTNTGPITYSCKCASIWEGPNCNTVHCLSDTTQCTGLPYGRYASCGNCAQFMACRAKRQKLRTCSLYPWFDRVLRKCTSDKTTACAAL